MKYEEGMGDPLAMLAEECAEVIVEVMKCQRFGLAGTKAWVAAGNDPPRLRMVQELADVLEVASILQARGVFTVTELSAARDKKRLRLHELFGPEPTGEKGERIPSGEIDDAMIARANVAYTASIQELYAQAKYAPVDLAEIQAKAMRAAIEASPPPAKAEDGIEMLQEAREHVALRLDGMERIGATAEAKRSARSLLQRMDAALAKEGTP